MLCSLLDLIIQQSFSDLCQRISWITDHINSLFSRGYSLVLLSINYIRCLQAHPHNLPSFLWTEALVGQLVWLVFNPPEKTPKNPNSESSILPTEIHSFKCADLHFEIPFHQMSLQVMLQGKMRPPFYPPLTVGLLENVFWGQCMSHNIIITWFVSDVKLDSKPSAVSRDLDLQLPASAWLFSSVDKRFIKAQLQDK